MATVSSLDGSISLITTNGTVTQDIIDAIGADGATFSSSRDLGEVTKDGDAFKASVGGWYEWSISVPFRYPGASPAHSVNSTGAFITDAGGGLYLSNLRQWSLTLSVPYVEVTTGDSATAPTGKKWQVSDVISVTGSFTALVDSGSSNALASITADDTGTFAIVGWGSGTDEAIAVPTRMTGKTVTRARGQATSVQYSFEGTGAIQHVGTDGGTPAVGLFGANGTLANITAPTPEEEQVEFLMIDNGGGDERKITGRVSWSSLTISRDVNAPLGGTLELRGSDDYYIDAVPS